MWPRFGPVLLYLVCSWLTLGLPLAYLLPKFGKQEWTGQVPSFFTVCGPEQGVGSGPELKSMWPRFGPVLPLFGLFMADIGPSFGLLVAQI